MDECRQFLTRQCTCSKDILIVTLSKVLGVPGIYFMRLFPFHPYATFSCRGMFPSVSVSIAIGAFGRWAPPTCAYSTSTGDDL